MPSNKKYTTITKNQAIAFLTLLVVAVFVIGFISGHSATCFKVEYINANGTTFDSGPILIADWQQYGRVPFGDFNNNIRGFNIILGC